MAGKSNWQLVVHYENFCGPQELTVSLKNYLRDLSLISGLNEYSYINIEKISLRLYMTYHLQY